MLYFHNFDFYSYVKTTPLGRERERVSLGGFKRGKGRGSKRKEKPEKKGKNNRQ